MQKLYSILIAIAMTAMFTPGAFGSYTDTAQYDIPSGPVRVKAGDTTVGPALSTRPCAPEWDYLWDPDNEEEDLITDGDGLDWVVEEPSELATSTVCQTGRELRYGDADQDDGVVNMGVFSRAIQSEEDLYTEFVWTITDSAFDATYFTGCIITDHSDGSDDNSCGDEDADPVTGESTNTPDFPVSGCGSAATTTGDVPSGRDNRVATFIYGVWLDGDTLETCFGSAGTLTVVMS